MPELLPQLSGAKAPDYYQIGGRVVGDFGGGGGPKQRPAEATLGMTTCSLHRSNNTINNMPCCNWAGTPARSWLVAASVDASKSCLGHTHRQHRPCMQH
jgi:hypothetical protein